MKKIKSLMRLIGVSLALLLLFTAGACVKTQAEESVSLDEKETENMSEGTKEISLSKMKDLSGLVLQFIDEDTLVLKQNGSVLKTEHLQKDICVIFSNTFSSVLPNINQPDFSSLQNLLVGKEFSLSQATVSKIKWFDLRYSINATFSNNLTVVFTEDKRLVLFEGNIAYFASVEEISEIRDYWDLFYESQKE